MKRLDFGFDQDIWYENLEKIAGLTDITRRYSALYELQIETQDFYLPMIQRISESDSLKIGSNNTTVAGVIGHISAWESWRLQVFKKTNFRSAVVNQMALKGFQDSRGVHNFTSIDHFNSYIQARNHGLRWEVVQREAVDTSLELGEFFPSQPTNNLLNLLESSPINIWRIQPDLQIRTPVAWQLWMASLEHEAVNIVRI
jgi:hypothetical protein